MNNNHHFKGISTSTEESCAIEVGKVAASMTRNTLQELVDEYYWIKAHKVGSTVNVFAAPNRSSSQWIAIGWIRERSTFSLNLRGVVWEVDEREMDTFIAESAAPFLSLNKPV